MIRIESKMTGEIVETPTNRWRENLNLIKYYASCEGIKINTKATSLITNLNNGYEDDYIKAYIHR